MLWPGVPLRPSSKRDAELLYLSLEGESFGEGAADRLREVATAGETQFILPRELATADAATVSIPTADSGRVLAGNPLQRASQMRLGKLASRLRRLGGRAPESLWSTWRILATADSTDWMRLGDESDIVSAMPAASYYATPEDAYVNLMNVAAELSRQIESLETPPPRRAHA